MEQTLETIHRHLDECIIQMNMAQYNQNEIQYQVWKQQINNIIQMANNC